MVINFAAKYSLTDALYGRPLHGFPLLPPIGPIRFRQVTLKALYSLTGIILPIKLNRGEYRLSAQRVYLATSFAWGLLFFVGVTTFMIYQVEVVMLDPLQLVLVGTALEVSAFVCEVPTGIVADNYSRKLSVGLGYLITGIAFFMMGGIPHFAALIVGSLIWGLGWTFISGAHQAWLADEIGESEAASYYLKGARVRNYGALLGILIAVLIGQLEVHYPILLSGVLFFLWGITLFAIMPEDGFSPAGDSGSGFKNMADTFKQGVTVIRGSSTLILLMIVGVVYGTFSEGYDRLAAAHLLRGFEFTAETGYDPVIVFGVMSALGIVLSAGLVAVAERVVDTDSARQLALSLSVATATILIFVLAFALSGYIWIAIVMYILLQPVRSVVEPLTMAWFNRNIPSASRATIISMHSQSDALGQMAGGPGVGLIGREFGVRLAISLTALLLAPAIWLYARASTNAIYSDNTND